MSSRLIEGSYVVWIETGEERRVLRDCKSCLALSPPSGISVVSPTGIAHIALTGGDTLCGKDATGDRWWWPE